MWKVFKPIQYYMQQQFLLRSCCLHPHLAQPVMHYCSSKGSPPKVKAVIFDMGGVIIPHPGKVFAEIDEKFGLPKNTCLQVIVENGNEGAFALLERGELSLQEFEESFSQECSKKLGFAVTLNNSFSSLLAKAGLPYKEMLEAIQCIKSEGIKTALLTNNWMISPTETLMPLDKKLFDVIVESCLVRMRKPDPRIFQFCLDQLQVKPEESIFLDDLGINLKNARALGIHTIKVNDPKSALQELQSVLQFPLDNYIPGTTRMRKGLELPIDSLTHYLQNVLHLQDTVPPIVKQFAHGQSNPTYYVNYGSKKMVLRKKPPGKLLQSAHAIDREYRIMKAMDEHGIPVPKMLSYCDDVSVVGTPFYLMEFVEGRIFLDPLLPDKTASERAAIYGIMNDVLCKIHKVDINKAGLQDYGKQGLYVQRQVSRWTKQYQQSETHTIPVMNSLIEWVNKNLPSEEKITVVHGDFRLDNLIFHPERPEIVAVLDWELSTIGDPLTDLASNCIPYHLRGDFDILKGFINRVSDFKELGLPTEQDYVDQYCKCMMISPINNWNFYICFTFFRMAAILQGVYKRAISGQASSARGKAAGLLAEEFATIGWSHVSLNQKRHYSSSTRQYSSTEIQGMLPIHPSAISPQAQTYYNNVKKFLQNHILPIEKEIIQHHLGDNKWSTFPKIEELKIKAKKVKLWNLFLPLESDPEKKYGAGLTNIEYAFICEEMGKCLFASEVFNCGAPDTGNIEVLVKYGTEKQKEMWLKPLLEGKIKSCFAMTEPSVASSDATNIQSSIIRDGNHYIINGHKWWITGALHPHCKLCIFMGKTNVKASKYAQQSMILVPMDTPGIRIIRPLSAIGMLDAPGGHAEIIFENVRVPVENILLGEGRGFEIAQGRLGPGRIHHCMRLIGHAERTLELMLERITSRTAFGKLLAEYGTIQADIAKSRIEIEQARLLVLKAAHMMDTVGNKVAAPEIAMIKIIAPNVVQTVVDRAIQAFGAAGVSDDYPLAAFFVWARCLRLADGPDEVHLRAIAQRELKKSKL